MSVNDRMLTGFSVPTTTCRSSGFVPNAAWNSARAALRSSNGIGAVATLVRLRPQAGQDGDELVAQIPDLHQLIAVKPARDLRVDLEVGRAASLGDLLEPERDDRAERLDAEAGHAQDEVAHLLDAGRRHFDDHRDGRLGAEH